MDWPIPCLGCGAHAPGRPGAWSGRLRAATIARHARWRRRTFELLRAHAMTTVFGKAGFDRLPMLATSRPSSPTCCAGSHRDTVLPEW